MKQLKDELEGKELHLDMMRKKVASLEEKSGGRMEVWREKEELEGRSKKMERMNERLRAQLGDCKVSPPVSQSAAAATTQLLSSPTRQHCSHFS